MTIILSQPGLSHRIVLNTKQRGEACTPCWAYQWKGTTTKATLIKYYYRYNFRSISDLQPGFHSSVCSSSLCILLLALRPWDLVSYNYQLLQKCISILETWQTMHTHHTNLYIYVLFFLWAQKFLSCITQSVDFPVAHKTWIWQWQPAQKDITIMKYFF